MDPTVVGDNQSLWPWSVVIGIAPSLPFCSSLWQAKQSYHRTIDQKTSVRMQKSSSSPGKFNRWLYISLSYMLLSCEKVYFGVWTTLFVVRCIHDWYLLMGVHCYEHWSCIKHRMQCLRISNPVLYWIIVQDTVFCIGMQSSYKECIIWATFGQKSAAWQSTLMRGTFLGHTWSKSAEKVLQWRAIFEPHLVEVHCVTKFSDEGHIFGPHLVKCPHGFDSQEAWHYGCSWPSLQFWQLLGPIDWQNQRKYNCPYWYQQPRISVHLVSLCTSDPLQSCWTPHCVNWELFQQGGRVHSHQDKPYIYPSFSLRQG